MKNGSIIASCYFYSVVHSCPGVRGEFCSAIDFTNVPQTEYLFTTFSRNLLSFNDCFPHFLLLSVALMWRWVCYLNILTLVNRHTHEMLENSHLTFQNCGTTYPLLLASYFRPSQRIQAFIRHIFAQCNNAMSDHLFRHLEWVESGVKAGNEGSMTK